MLISDIIECIERFAPVALQEGYDNTGLQIGDSRKECTGVLLCVDVTPEVIEEAVEVGANLVISHHPLFFKGLKRLTGDTLVQRTAISAIRNGIAVYSSHTAVDNTSEGISCRMAGMLGLKDIRVLEPQSDRFIKLTVWTPKSHTDRVKQALFDIGCGKMGGYSDCCYQSEGEGSYRPLPQANPWAGETGVVHHEPEAKLEITLPEWLKNKAIKAIIDSHPYEHPAFDFSKIEIGIKTTGTGAYGHLDTPLSPLQLIDEVKRVFNSPVARCNRFPDNSTISKVALCGGAGSFLIPKAISLGAQAFLTSDTKYHDFVDYSDSILLIDIGHFESERCAKNIFHEIITENFPNFAVNFAQCESNPIIYR